MSKMSSFISNHTLRIKIIFLIIFFALMFSSCFSVVKSQPWDNKIRYRKNKGDFNINISAKFEKLVLNSSTGNIKLYVRFINKITPNNPQKLKRVVKINVGKAEPIGESYFVKIAKAPKSEPLNYEELIRLKFGELVIQPVNRLSTEFNAIDQYGKGSFEFLAEITVRPREEISDEESAKDYISDLCYENKIGFNYSISIEHEKGRKLSKKIYVVIQEKILQSNKEFFVLSVQL